jgi:hypothetical protein
VPCIPVHAQWLVGGSSAMSGSYCLQYYVPELETCYRMFCIILESFGSIPFCIDEILCISIMTV